MKRFAYLGTSIFAAKVLEQLQLKGHSPQLVMTRPDRPSGRGRRLSAPPVAEYAQEQNFPLSQPENINSEEAFNQVKAADPDVVVVCAYGGLIKEPLLSAFPTLNVHPSLLPRWRGAAPIERSIMAGDSKTGVSIIQLVEELDAGPICLVKEEAIASDDNYASLSERLILISAELIAEALLSDHEFLPQSEQGLTYAEKILPEDKLLDPANSAEELLLRVRALTPHIGTKLKLADGSELGVHGAHLPDLSELDSQSLGVGELVAIKKRLLMGCGQQTLLELDLVQPPGGKRMDAASYIRGYMQ